jgi:hypothetical protein
MKLIYFYIKNYQWILTIICWDYVIKVIIFWTIRNTEFSERDILNKHQLMTVFYPIYIWVGLYFQIISTIWNKHKPLYKSEHKI